MQRYYHREPANNPTDAGHVYLTFTVPGPVSVLSTSLLIGTRDVSAALRVPGSLSS